MDFGRVGFLDGRHFVESSAALLLAGFMNVPRNYVDEFSLQKQVNFLQFTCSSQCWHVAKLIAKIFKPSPRNSSSPD